MMSVALCFLPMKQEHVRDAAQLTRLLAFRDRAERERQHLFKQLDADVDFAAEMRATLGDWLRGLELSQGRQSFDVSASSKDSGMADRDRKPPSSIRPAPGLLKRAIERNKAREHEVALALVEEVLDG